MSHDSTTPHARAAHTRSPRLGLLLLVSAALVPLAACMSHEPAAVDGRSEPAGAASSADLDDATIVSSTPAPAADAPIATEQTEADEGERAAEPVTTVASGSAPASGPAPAARPAPAKQAKRKSAEGITRSAPRPERADLAASSGAVAGRSTPAPEARPMAPPQEPVAQSAVPQPDDAPSMDGNTHTDHGVNPFTMASEDALSTFSIDVDTASYSLARRSLESGRLPSQAGVRVEEFVNYLDYGTYTAPTGDVPFAVHMEAMPDPFRAGRHILRVGVQGAEVDKDQRAPVHLTFLVDVSGSMSSADKLGLAKKSLHKMVDQLREDDTVAIATYAGRTARVLPPTRASHGRQIHRAIDNLSAGGSTAMSSGIDIAYDMAAQTFLEGHENRVVVLSDGDANVGRTSWDEMLSQIKGHADRGITLSTIGLGTGNYRDTLMEQLANNGDGNNFYIDSEAQSDRVFVEQLPGTLVTIARDVKIQVEFHPESVKAYRLIGYENRDIADHQFRNDRVDAGEIGSGHNVTALYEVILADDYAPELATVRMRWEAPGADKAASERAYVFPEQALRESTRQASRDTRVAFAAATFAEILRGSPHVSELDMAALQAFMQSSARPGEEDDRELLDLMARADALGAGARSAAVSAR